MHEIIPNLYTLEVCFKQHVGAPVNVYIIKQDGRSMLIDPGTANAEGTALIENTLRTLNIAYDELDVFLTHEHNDHSVMAPLLAKRGARILMHPDEAVAELNFRDCVLLDSELHSWYTHAIGITPELEPKTHLELSRICQEEFTWERHIVRFPFEEIFGGDSISFPDFDFDVIALPGHCVGQLGLADARHKLLICADQVISGIVPVVITTEFGQNMLETYFDSLRNIKTNFGDYTLLSGHGPVITNPAAVIDHIFKSYRIICERIYSIVRNSTKPLTTHQIAKKLYGIRSINSINDAYTNYYLLTSKTLTCLEYLHTHELIRQSEQKNVLFWSQYTSKNPVHNSDAYDIMSIL